MSDIFWLGRKCVFLWETPDLLLTSRGYSKCFRLQKAKVFKKVKKRAIGYSLFCRTASRLPGISPEYHLSYPAVTRIFETSGFFSIINASWKAENSPETVKSTMPTSVGKERVKGPKGAAGKVWYWACWRETARYIPK